MGHSKQNSFFKTNWRHRDCHGGSLRNSRQGRGQRPLSTKHPLHVVFKINKQAHKSGLRSPKTYLLVTKTIDRYTKKFFVKFEKVSIQRDHIHLLIRTSKHSFFQHFFRVVAGQIAQKLGRATDTPKLGARRLRLWKFRPYSRVVRGLRAWKIVRNYIQLNECEALGKITYQKHRHKAAFARTTIAKSRYPRLHEFRRFLQARSLSGISDK